MRNLIVGLICGIILTFGTAAVASNSVQAILFPSKITIHVGDQVKELNTSSGTTVLNYKNHVYIPLRTFSETMDSHVNYSEATIGNGNLNQIEIFSQSSLTGLNILSEDNSVALGNLISESSPGHTRITGGMIKINKELKGKQIVLEVLDENGKVKGSSDYFYIDGENIKAPSVGDIKSFRTELNFDHNAASYKVIVHDIISKKKNDDLDLRYPSITKPLFGNFVPPPFLDEQVSKFAVIPYKFTLLNTSENTLHLDDIPLALIVNKGNPDGSAKKIVYQLELPSIKGTLAPLESFEINIPWYQYDQNGKVQPGLYFVTVEIPNKIQFLNEGTGTKEFWDVKLQYGTTFQVEIK